MAGSASIDRRFRAETRPVTTKQAKPAEDDRPTLKRPDPPRPPSDRLSERTIPERPSHRNLVPARAPTSRPAVVATDVASGVIVAAPPRERPSQRRADSRATTERRNERFARGTSPPPDHGAPPDQLARGTAPNDALDRDDDALETGVHTAQSDVDDPLVAVLNALSPPGESIDTEPFERAQPEGPVKSGPQMPTMIVQPPPHERRSSSPSVENHVVRAWDPEHTSSTQQQLMHYQPTDQMWLGCVVSPPTIGAALVIGRFMQPDFTVTSPVTKIITRHDGMLVQTTTKNRYFVDNGGATYLVRRLG